MNLLCVSTDLTSAELAAWVQAIGSIGAILAAAGIAIFQARAQHRSALAIHRAEQQHGRVELTKSVATLANNSAKALKHVSEKLRNREAVHAAGDGELYVDLEEIRRIDNALANIPLHTVPSSLVTPTMILSSTIRQFLCKVEMALQLHRKLGAPEFEDFFRTLDQMNESLAATCADIETAARKAQCEA